MDILLGDDEINGDIFVELPHSSVNTNEDSRNEDGSGWELYIIILALDYGKNVQVHLLNKNIQHKYISPFSHVLKLFI